MIRNTTLVLFLLGTFFNLNAIKGFSQQLTRDEFVSKLNKIPNRIPMNEVRKIVGEPDGILVTNYSTVWFYGCSEEKEDFPTLGQVHFDFWGNLDYFFGGGEPTPGLEGMDESEIRLNLNLIDEMPGFGFSGAKWNPQKVIEISNSIGKLGQLHGLAVVEEYLRVAPINHGSRDKVCLLLRLLHETPSLPNAFPKLKFGDVLFKELENCEQFSSFPIYIHNEIPLMLTHGYASTGSQTMTRLDILGWYKSNGIWRKRPFNPSQLSDEEIMILTQEVAKFAEAHLGSSTVERFNILIKRQLELFQSEMFKKRNGDNTETGTTQKRGQHRTGDKLNFETARKV